MYFFTIGNFGAGSEFYSIFYEQGNIEQWMANLINL